MILKLIEDYSKYNRDIIVIEPQKYIFEQLQKKMKKYGLASDHVKFLTYSALGKMNDEKIKQFSFPKMVIVDDERVIIRTKLEKPSKIKGLALI